MKITSQGAGRPFAINETIKGYRACQLSGHIFIGPTTNGLEGLSGIKDGDEAIFRYVEWERSVNQVFISGTSSGNIYFFLDKEEEAKGLIVFEKGKIISSSFHGLLGKHQLRLI